MKICSALYNDSLLKVKEMDMGVTHKPCGSPLYQLGKSKYKREIAKSDSAFISGSLLYRSHQAHQVAKVVNHTYWKLEAHRR